MHKEKYKIKKRDKRDWGFKMGRWCDQRPWSDQEAKLQAVGLKSRGWGGEGAW